MNWPQVTDPLNHIILSALVAALPIAFLFWALIVNKMKGYRASLIAAAIALAIAITVYGMPVQLAMLSAGHGLLYGLFPICWIVVAAVFLFNLTVESGQFEVIRQFMASVTGDRRLQALIIAFSFGSFLEGTAGFGAPVAITAAMLVGLGFNPLYAAGLCLIANTAPVAFGAIGTPILVASQVSGIPDTAISQMVGRTLPTLSLLVPFYLVVLMAGFRNAVEVLPAVVVSGLSFAGLQWFSANFLGPTLPDIISGIGSIVCLIVFLKYWKPARVWRFKDEPVAIVTTGHRHTAGQVFRAWSPFIILTILMIAWGIPPVKSVLDHLGTAGFEIPGLHLAIRDAAGNGIPHVFKFNFLSAAGTAIFIAAVVAMPVIGIRFTQGMAIFAATLGQLKFPIVTISTVLAFAYIVNDSGMTLSIAGALATTGWLFPLFSPILGWLGVFITGSDTSTNALFGRLQAATAASLGIDPVVTVGANASGGVVGKMISPQSIAVAAGAGGLAGRESDLFRFTVKHSFIMLAFICALVFVQAYLTPWLIPSYTAVDPAQHTAAADLSIGFGYLAGFAVLVAAVAAVVGLQRRTEARATH